MKIVMRYDEKKNGFAIAPAECEGLPLGLITAKSYCETAGFLPNKIMIDVPGTIMSPDEEAHLSGAIDELKAAIQTMIEENAARVAELEKKLVVYEAAGDTEEPDKTDEGTDK